MARWKQDPEQKNRRDQEDTPLFDDFLYDDMQESSGMRRSMSFRSRDGDDDEISDAQEAAEDGAEDIKPENEASDHMVDRIRKRHGSASRQSEEEAAGETAAARPPRRLRRAVMIIATLVISAVLLSMFFYRITNFGILGVPEDTISGIVSPVQSVFSAVTGSISDYLRRVKLRSNLEAAYNELRAENEQLVYRAMYADELETRLAQYENMNDEVQANRNLNPVVARVVGRDDQNYFSVFTINKGSRDGINNYMAVTISGALVGYTENVRETSSTVRCIIDSDASIAALIQSSRDQGTVTGTLGLDGKWSCRMYYLSEDRLPRPGDVVVTSGVGMSFPKGIPIGVVRESTRGMDQNKQYIVVEPTVDFAHIEYVIVLTYMPPAAPVTGRDNSLADMDFVALETARPYPTLRMISASLYGTATPAPESEETAAPDSTGSIEPIETAGPTGTPAALQTPAPVSEPVFEYQAVQTGPTASPSPTPTPSPTPYITLTPDDMTWEED